MSLIMREMQMQMQKKKKKAQWNISSHVLEGYHGEKKKKRKKC